MAKKIMIVDDSPTLLRLISEVLQKQHYRVTTADSGEAALDKIKKEKPDLMILDVILPERSGFQVCRQLKTQAETKGIKVILLSSKKQVSDRFWGMKQGADEYLTKPLQNETLVAAVSKLLAE